MSRHIAPRVLLTLRHFPPDGGGAEVVALNVAKRLGDWGVPVRVLTGRYHGRPEFDRVQGVPVRRHFVGPYIRGLHELCYLVSFGWYLFRHRDEYDVIHTFQTNLSTLLGAWLGGRLGKPVLTTAHGAGKTGDMALWDKIPFGRKLLRATADRVDQCTAVSKGVLEELIENGFKLEETSYIPNGVLVPKAEGASPSGLRESLGLPMESIMGLFVGRISPEKAPESLVRAWEVVAKRDPRLVLVFVGEGELRKKTEERARQAGLERRILFVGWMEDVQDYLKSADFFLLPSVDEGMPMALLEAMAAGLPVIASRVGGIGDVIEHGKNGLLFDSGDVETLTEHIISLAQSPALRKKLGDRGRTTVERQFSLDRSCKRYLALYRAAFSKKPS